MFACLLFNSSCESKSAVLLHSELVKYWVKKEACYVSSKYLKGINCSVQS